MATAPGTAPHRLEDDRLVHGRGRFVPDLRPPGLLHAAFVRSYLPHARIVEVDRSDAQGMTGVAGVFTADDLDLPPIPGATGRGPEVAMPREILARERVRYVGEPIALVVAEDRYTAADAAEMWVELDELPVVADPVAALEDASVLHPGHGSNLVSSSVVGVEDPADGPAGPVSVTVRVDNQRLAPAPIEPLGILCEPGEDGRLTVWCGHQAPHRLQRQLAGLLGLDAARIRVVVPDVGGAFGMKGMLFPEYVAVAAAALRLDRPVRWVENRTEHFLGGTHGRGLHHTVTLSGDPDGRVRRARVEIVADLGAYPHNGSQVPLFARFVAGGLYDLPDLSVTTRMVVTNRAPTGSYRGAGRPEAAYAIERAMEAYARACGLDPAEVRRRNLVAPDRMPYRAATGALYDSGDYPAALDLALRLADYDAVRAEQAQRRARGDHGLGIGIGAFVERAGGAIGSDEYARVELADDGHVVVRTGTCATGQGHRTVWSQLTSAVLGVAADTVEVVAGDTDAVADGIGSFASRSAQVGGSAIHLAAGRLRDRLRDLAAEHLEVDPADLQFRDGEVAVTGAPQVAVTLADLGRLAAEHGVAVHEEERFDPQAQTFPYGVHVAVVEVDGATGRVEIRKLVAVDDCGNVLHPEIVEGQVVGSLMQGIAQALYEGLQYEDGQLRTTTFAEYHVPTAMEAPPIVSDRLVSPAPSNPLGVKGSGESGCIGAPPAIVNAVLDALEPLGVDDLQMPLTARTVWSAIQRARRS
ncbi:xanthine dehydrogenase family protein molybdopterin-binding subunit [Egicoccus sp. AB-alg6-2]|uniref:xanthine dehydrogenase family protein molybdopterin-binding subunit n=1 Tax=Egicoccus sp. AB-alg6-2 TaxID=3242692 RepID=UPI00359D865E